MRILQSLLLFFYSECQNDVIVCDEKLSSIIIIILCTNQLKDNTSVNTGIDALFFFIKHIVALSVFTTGMVVNLYTLPSFWVVGPLP